jgi:hypothetical protein
LFSGQGGPERNLKMKLFELKGILVDINQEIFNEKDTERLIFLAKYRQIIVEDIKCLENYLNNIERL